MKSEKLETMPSKKEQQPILPAAGRTSVTIIHDSTKSYGLRLTTLVSDDFSSSQSKKDKGNDIVIDMIANNHDNGMLKGSPMKEGDILRTINNRKAYNFLGCSDSIRSGSFQDGQSVTFVTEPPPENESDEQDNNDLDIGSPVVRAFCRRSLRANQDGNAKAVGVEFHRVIVGEEDNEDRSENEGSQESDNDCEGDESTSSPATKSSFLQIDRIDPNGLFAHSVLNQGDIVLAINGYSICADENTTVEEANELLGIHPALEKASSSSSPACETTMGAGISVYETVDILALNPRKLLELKRQGGTSRLWSRAERRRWMKRQAKRAGVALSGGTMIGIGAVVHPFGTLLLCSGVSVLGTEFETPNRIVRSARNSLEKWTMDDEQVLEFSKENNETSEDSESESLFECSSQESRAASDIASNNSLEGTTKSTPSSPPLPPLPTVTNRVKGLGRRYILPFLDKMAGDRRMPRNIESSSSFDIGDDYNHGIGSSVNQHPHVHGQQQQQQQQRVQGRDDDFHQNHGLSNSPEHPQQPSSASQRMT